MRRERGQEPGRLCDSSASSSSFLHWSLEVVQWSSISGTELFTGFLKEEVDFVTKLAIMRLVNHVLWDTVFINVLSKLGE